MPIYEYACVAHGHRFEVFQKMSDDPPDTCPVCGEHEIKKMVTAAAFVLKGGGWYKDHYGLKSGASSEASGASSDKPSSDKPSADKAAPSSSGDKGGGSSGGSSAGGASSGGSSTSSSGGSGTSASP